MAKFNGANLRYDNSDETDRVYHLTAEVVVNNGEPEAVQNINISKDGMGIGYCGIHGLNGDHASIDLNLSSLAASELKQATDAMIDFAMGLVAKVREENSKTAE